MNANDVKAARMLSGDAMPILPPLTLSVSSERAARSACSTSTGSFFYPVGVVWLVETNDPTPRSATENDSAAQRSGSRAYPRHYLSSKSTSNRTQSSCWPDCGPGSDERVSFEGIGSPNLIRIVFSRVPPAASAQRGTRPLRSAATIYRDDEGGAPIRARGAAARALPPFPALPDQGSHRRARSRWLRKT